MAFVLNDRVKQTSTTTGTGTFSLTGTEVGFETFVTGIGDTNSTFYAIALDGTAQFEVGIGTVTDAATDTLSRDTVISSSNSDNKVDFAAGTKTVFKRYLLVLKLALPLIAISIVASFVPSTLLTYICASFLDLLLTLNLLIELPDVS